MQLKRAIISFFALYVNALGFSHVPTIGHSKVCVNENNYRNRSLPLLGMRILAIVMAIWISVMSVMPCADAADNCAEETHLVAQAADEHDTGDTHTDLCSPFCVCHCCHSNSLVTTFLAAFYQVAAAEIPDQYIAPVANTLSRDIFRPPKV